MIQIIAINGKKYSGLVFVDPEDYEYLSQFTWHIDQKGYVYRHAWIDDKRTTVKMHREIMNCPPGMTVDHRNGDRLNNRRCNLRICTGNQNAKNRKKNSRMLAQYKGLDYIPWSKKWRARIQANGKRVHLGVFATQEDAAQAYNAAAVKYHDEFANLNGHIGCR